ncbi:helix-turn-helix transcriptional regulator [Virgisporangium aurantiacum]|uniref:DNA-binding protein n=1 Tax=Virgisporangium aurantiacum TaxID=175570 RepID=A0A8J3Z7P1_9ACTN|nr:helix-turn-helix transcriptional regulator [Virgisporangium aurantiacum]GIJ56423.1 DNA-binding protein [Virgisporangium aurantiacum]
MESRRAELGRFLRSRRERITPGEVGLSNSDRRRTPGLRREEVAALADVGVSWYTWLEQGRDIQASAAVLGAVARALRLDPHERRHLFALAGALDPAATAAPAAAAVPPEIFALLGQLDPFPANVQNARSDLLAYNTAYRLLISDLDALPADDRNVAWLTFTHPAWRRSLADWPVTADRVVAQLRAARAGHRDDPAWCELLDRLRDASPEFARRWRAHDIAQPEARYKAYLHPRLGLLRFTHTQLWLGPTSTTRLTTFIPIGADTRTALDRLVASPMSAGRA